MRYRATLMGVPLEEGRVRQEFSNSLSILKRWADAVLAVQPDGASVMIEAQSWSLVETVKKPPETVKP
jgi:hypothetical protein